MRNAGLEETQAGIKISGLVKLVITKIKRMSQGCKDLTRPTPIIHILR